MEHISEQIVCTMNVGAMGRAINDFVPHMEGELPLRKGNIVQIHKISDKYWFYGNHAGNFGKFPASCIVEVQLPLFQDGQKLFVALQGLSSQIPGDLSFNKDDIIIGISPVDLNWWNGNCQGRTGIFPVTYVWDCDTSLWQRNNNQVTTKKLKKRASVKLDLKAQIEEEMDLHKGAIITVTEIIDDDWYRGEHDGKTGIFPASFVTLLDDSTFEHVATKEAENVAPPQQENHVLQNHYNPSLNKTATIVKNADENADMYTGFESVPYVLTKFPFTAKHSDELGFSEGEIIWLIKHMDDEWLEGYCDGRQGIFPKSYVDIILDCPNVCANTNNTNFTDQEQKQEVLPVEIIPEKTQARVLFDYVAQASGDLMLVENEILTIINKKNADWYEARDCQGNVGLCPANYIDLLPFTPNASDNKQNSHSRSITSRTGLIQNNSLNSIVNEPCKSLKTSNLMESSILNISQVHGSQTLISNQSYNSGQNFSLPSQTDTSTKRNFNKADFTKPPSIGNRDLDQSILKNLATLNVSTLSSGPKRSENRSRSFHEFSSRPSDKNKDWHLKNKLMSDVLDSDPLRRRATSFNSQIPPPRPAPPRLVVQARLETECSSKPPDLIPQVSIKNEIREPPPPIPPPPKLCLENFPEVTKFIQDSPEKPPPLRKAPPPPITQNQQLNTENFSNYNGHSNNKPKFPHRPAPPVPVIYNSEKRASQDASQFYYSLDETNSIRPNVVQLRSAKQELDSHHLISHSFPGCEGRKTFKSGVHTNEYCQMESNEEHNKEQKDNSLEQRKMVIAELIQTEQTYIRDLRLCIEIFMRNPEEGKVKGVDMDILFGNLKEIVGLAEKMYSNLLNATSDNSQEIAAIGQCFQKFSEDMKNMYGHYCANQEEVNNLLDKYQDDLEIQHYFSEKMAIINQQVACLNVNAFLIKPVQRILKYPLLLRALLKHVDDDDPEKIELVKAIHVMTDLATSVNEFKRRKDLVSKYLKDEDTSLSSMLAKINMHSVVKKSTRIGMRLSSTMGLTTVTKDEAFIEEEIKFRSLEKTVRMFAKDVTAFCMQVEEWTKTQFQLAEDIALFYMEECNCADVDQYRTVQRELFSHILTDFKNFVGKRVAIPLNTLLQTFSGPLKLIEKRFDKLLDFDSVSSRLEKNKDNTKSAQLNEECMLTRNIYEALNLQLLEELPKLFSVALFIFEDCVSDFLVARKRFIGRVLKETMQLSELPIIKSSYGDILEEFLSNQKEATTQLMLVSFVPKNMFASKSEVTKTVPDKKQKSIQSSSSPVQHDQTSQTDEHRNKLRSSYSPTKLFVASKLHQANDEFEITLQPGDLIGVIKEQDPMGSKSRWFVDNGIAKGFVLASCLQRSEGLPTKVNISQTPVNISSLPIINLPSNPSQSQDFHASNDRYDIPYEPPGYFEAIANDRYDLPPEEEEDALSQMGAEFNQLQEVDSRTASPYNLTLAESNFYFAAYDFTARTESELSIQNGQTVLVIHKQDLEGNTDWWFVEDRFGNNGFVPANYLSKSES